MSHKAPKKYSRQAGQKVTPEEERQARRLINGIVIALIALMAITMLVYKFLE